MYGAGTQQLLSDHFSTGSTDLPFPNSIGMWMSAEQLVKSYHQIKALCTHSCVSKIVWHWASLDMEAQPTCSTSSNIPTCRWTLHLSPAEFYETLPPLTPPLLTGFFQKKGKADFSIFNIQGVVVILHRARKENACVCVEKYILFPCSATKSASSYKNLPFRGHPDRNISRGNCRLLEFNLFYLWSSVCQ